MRLWLLAAVVVLAGCAPVLHDVNPCPDVTACVPVDAPAEP